jgi:hypothetical protein
MLLLVLLHVLPMMGSLFALVLSLLLPNCVILRCIRPGKVIPPTGQQFLHFEIHSGY